MGPFNNFSLNQAYSFTNLFINNDNCSFCETQLVTEFKQNRLC